MRASDIQVGEFYARNRSMWNNYKGEVLEVGVRGPWSPRNDHSMVKVHNEDGTTYITEWPNRDIQITWAEWLERKATEDAKEASEKAEKDAIRARVQVVADKLGLNIVNRNYRNPERGIEIEQGGYWDVEHGVYEYEPAVQIPLALIEDVLRIGEVSK